MAKEQVAKIHELAGEILKTEGVPETSTEYLRQIENISNGILEEM